METKLLKKQGGEYRYMPYGTPLTPYCDICTSDIYVYPEIAKYSDFPEDIRNNCPIVPGNYSFHGTKVNLEKFPRMALQSGEYAAEIKLHLNSEIVSIYRVYAFVNNI
ncbi:uncharacterized protein [Chironomus tepperi]|uniref:uncharacterized protein n=1 Tax=Chironomus tepperi TaxID=113505 RepID=UPI00391F92E2